MGQVLRGRRGVRRRWWRAGIWATFCGRVGRCGGGVVLRGGDSAVGEATGEYVLLWWHAGSLSLPSAILCLWGYCETIVGKKRRWRSRLHP